MSFDNYYDDRLPRIAEGYRQMFETNLRPDDTPYWRIKPEYRTEGCAAPNLIREVHDAPNNLPDDYLYEFTVDALNAIAEADEDDDFDAEIPDGFEAPSSHNELLAWLGSHSKRAQYIEDTKTDPYILDWNEHSLYELIQRGYEVEMRAVYADVLAHLREVAEDQYLNEPDEEEEDDE